MVEEGRDSAGNDGEPAAHVHTFLIADVRGYTRFTQEHGDEEAGRLAAAFARLSREVVVASGGKVIEFRGDEALCVFNSARQAIRAAVELQRDFRRQAEGGSLFPLPIGIGLDAGEAVPIEGGYRGAALNTAARLCSLAQPGQILATETTVTLAQKVDGIRFRERRAVRLKGLEKPVRLIEVESVEPLPPLPVVAVQPGGRGRRTWVAVGIAAAIVAAAALFAAVRSGGGDSQQRLAGNSIGAIDSGGVRSQRRLGGAPSALASAKDAVWIASTSAGTVSRLDRATNGIETLPVGGAPAGLAVGAGSLWVTNGDARALEQINQRTLTRIQTIPVGNGPASVAVGKDAVWVANTIDGSITRFDLTRGKVTDTIPVGPSPAAVAVGEGSVWVADYETGNVTRIDPRLRSITGSVIAGSGPRAIAVGAGAVWVANSRDGTVVRINPESMSLSGLVSVGADPSAITVGDDGVWVASSGSGSVSRIDPRTVRVTKRLVVGSRPAALVNSGGTIYAATVTPLAGHRGGVLRVEGEPSPCRCVDLIASLGALGYPVASVVYDGLVGYRRTAGRAGSTLVPDLALRLPAATENGTTYAFQLRPGLRYSDGSRVRASDFRASIERDLELNPFGDLGGITGAAKCRPKHRCDLSKGIEIDDGSRTIAIHLEEPDPEFLYLLALPEASVVPRRTPLHPRPDQPILGTGPYRVASSARGPTVRLVRNPYFRAWSTDARPEGYVDELRIHRTTNLNASARAVETGSADLVPLAVRGQTAEQQRGLLARVAGRLHLDAQPVTLWWFFNTRVAPFDDVRVRRAVNFAVDRARLNRLAGGLDSPTCQVLPSDLPGYRPYCPYTVNPNEGGTWTGPDLAKARSLVAASGTRGTRVAVTTVHRSVPLAIGRYFVSLFRQLGYNASLRVVDDPRAFGPFVANSRNRVQFGSTGWFADKLIPSNFLSPILTCAAFVPKSPRNQNYFEYCNPEIDAKIKKAALLQTSDPARANALWGEVDRGLVDQAVMLPWSAPRTRILVSARVGNYQNHALWGPLLDQIWVK